MAKKKQYSVHLPPNVARGAKVYAAKHDMNFSEAVERALRKVYPPVQKGKSHD